MSTMTAIVLGVIIGWVIEWIIDWIYWRRRAGASENQLAALKAEKKALQDKIAALEMEKQGWQGQPATRLAPVPALPDDLVVIKGIGPVIARKLNDAGILTFADLAAITPERLRAIVGESIQRLADEEDILSQARTLAAEKNRTASV